MTDDSQQRLNMEQEMENMTSHMNNLLNDAVAEETTKDLFALIDESDELRFAGEGTYGMTYFIQEKDRKVIVKTVLIFPPKQDPQTWLPDDLNVSMSEALLGSYYYTGRWKHGYTGQQIPRHMDRKGIQFDSKKDDPLPNIVNYSDFIILEDEELVLYYKMMIKASERVKDLPENIEALKVEHAAIEKHVKEGRIQRGYIMILEPGEPGTLKELIETDIDFPKYAIGMFVQLLSTLYLLRTEDGFVHGDAGINNIVRKFLPGTGAASVRYRVQNDSSEVMYLKDEHKGDFPLFMFIDLGLSRFDDRKVISLERIHERAIQRGRLEEARMLSWVSEWHEPKQTTIGNMHRSHAADKHLFGLDLLSSLAIRLYDRVDKGIVEATTMIWKIIRFIIDRLLIPPGNIVPGMHPVIAISQSMVMNFRIVYEAYFEVVDAITTAKNVLRLYSVISGDFSVIKLDKNPLSIHTNEPTKMIYHTLRFFPRSAITGWDDFRPFWTDSIFDDVRVIEEKRGEKRSAFVLLEPGVTTLTSDSLKRTALPELPVNQPIESVEKRRGAKATGAISLGWKESLNNRSNGSIDGIVML